MSSQLIQKVNVKLKDAGYRHSKLRDKILEVLDLSDEPITVQDLQKILKDAKLEPNKTTVYRELETLEHNKVINTVDLGEGKKRYELSTESSHPHLICTNCGSIKCAKLNITIESWLNSFCGQNNFKMQDHVLEFFGLCHICNK